VLTACTGGDDDNRAEGSTTRPDAPEESSTTAIERPDGPAADLSEEITGGNGVFIASPTPGDIGEGYIEQEYIAAGTASSFTAAEELTDDGRWTFEPDATAGYRTRVLVRRPENVADTSGVVIVEWLNVSSGIDSDPDFVTLQEEIVRQGHVWVGVSAQVTGVEGGSSAAVNDDAVPAAMYSCSM